MKNKTSIYGKDCEDSRPIKIRVLSTSSTKEEEEKVGEEHFSNNRNNHNPLPSTSDNDRNDTTRETEDHQKIEESNSDGQEKFISKNQLKKFKRRERWEANREYRKIKRREKQKEKKKAKEKERAVTLGAIKQDVENLEGDKTATGPINIENQKIENTKQEAPEERDDDEKTKKLTPSSIQKKIEKSKQLPIGIIIDVDFDELMTSKEIISLGAQITRCYSLNKSAPFRTHLVISSWGGNLKSRFESVLAKTHLNWTGVKFFPEDFIYVAKLLHDTNMSSLGDDLAITLSVKDSGTDSATKPNEMTDNVPVFKVTKNLSIEQKLKKTSDEHSPTSKSQSPTKSVDTEPLIQDNLVCMSDKTTAIIYLTSDSPNTLTHLAPNTSYVIGGIVDKNRHKGICYKRACERGIPTAKLPIGEYMSMQSRTVLAVNHVVEIMLKWLETKNWGESFLEVIPKRKNAVLKKIE